MASRAFSRPKSRSKFECFHPASFRSQKALFILASICTEFSCVPQGCTHQYIQIRRRHALTSLVSRNRPFGTDLWDPRNASLRWRVVGYFCLEHFVSKSFQTPSSHW
jgi:hypothetical protein